MLTVGEALVDLLEQYSVDTVFGIPGTHSIELYRGLEKSSIRHILPRHEQGGGFMADGYARITGKPGVCFVITGPGVTNITTPMGEAYMDSVPMLVISPVNRPDAGKYNRGRLHEITDQSAVTSPFTAFSATVNHQDDIPELIARAFSVFNSEQPRPVHISIPLEIMPQTVKRTWQAVKLPQMPQANHHQLVHAAQMINSAENALIIAGGGSRFSSFQVTALAEKAGIPVTTTVAGRGVIAASHFLAVGAQLRSEAVKLLAKESDLVIILGSELAQTDHWDDDLPAQLTKNQIRVNLNTGALLCGNETLAINADVGAVINELLPLIDQAGSQKNDQAQDRISAVRNQLPDSMTAKEQKHMKVLHALMSALPEDSTVVSDMTQLAYTAIDFIALEKPNSWFHPTGYGTLGYALPAGMGASIAKPAQPVLVIVGDAGLQYTIQELTLAAELNLNVTILLWNNDALLQIRDDMVNANIDPLAVTQKNPDFINLAQACGWDSVIANDLEKLSELLVSSTKPTTKPIMIQLNELELE